MPLLNSYSRLPEQLFTFTLPTAVKHPQLLIYNDLLAHDLELPPLLKNEKIMSGNEILSNTTPLAQAYAGHQFGGFTKLGDGRAILLGEHAFNNQLFDVQLKGSGPTVYSRRGDGRATLKAMLREYLISESMHALNIPTTRSLAVVTTGEQVYRQPIQQGAILTRIAKSHIRVGTFEYIARFSDTATLSTFVDYTIERHYPALKEVKNKALSLLNAVITKQAELIVNWLRVGFIHGVMNTDNMSIAGETIDYGPCAFMNAYNPATVYSSIDVNGRYAFGQQGSIALWNLTRFAETLLPLIAESKEDAIGLATESLNTFQTKYFARWWQMMGNKLGLKELTDTHKPIITELLQWMQKNQADYTNTFVHLGTQSFSQEAIYKQPEFLEWQVKWLLALNGTNNNIPTEAIELMHGNNPFVIPRNHIVEDVLDQMDADVNSLELKNYLRLLSSPYSYGKNSYSPHYYMPPSSELEQEYQTFCGT